MRFLGAIKDLLMSAGVAPDSLRKLRGTFMHTGAVLKQISSGTSYGNELAVGEGPHWVIQACT